MKRNEQLVKTYFPSAIAIVSFLCVIGLLFLGICNGWVVDSVKSVIYNHRQDIAAQTYYTAVSEVNDKNIRLVAGVIRNSGDGWQLIEDKNHSSLNCDSVYIVDDGKCVTVDYSELNVKKVVSFVVCPDETFASLGYTCGASAGTDYTNIYIYENSEGVVLNIEPSLVVSETGNFWFIGVFEI